MLIFGGCAKKASVEVVETPAPPAPVPEVVEPLPGKVATVTVSEPVAVTPRKVDKRMETVLFEYDSAKLTSSAQRLLNNNAEWLRNNPQMKTIIEGHCDERGSDNYNLALGERRARAAKDYLAKLGITSERFDIISYGEERPVRKGHTEADWKLNRRVEFKPQL